MSDRSCRTVGASARSQADPFELTWTNCEETMLFRNAFYRSSALRVARRHTVPAVASLFLGASVVLGQEDAAPGARPPLVHFCGPQHCFTLTWQDGHYKANNGGIWEVVSFTQQSVILNRRDPTGFSSFYSGQIAPSGDTLVNVISGNGSYAPGASGKPVNGGARFAWGAALNSVPGNDSNRAIENLIQKGADRDVLSFFSWRPGQPFGRFHGMLDYNWTTDRRCGSAIPGGCVISPAVSYVEGLPDAPGIRGKYDTYFDGTDGQAIYVTLGIGGGDANRHYRIEHSGKATKISAIPKGLRGGNSSQAY